MYKVCLKLSRIRRLSCKTFLVIFMIIPTTLYFRHNYYKENTITANDAEYEAEIVKFMGKIIEHYGNNGDASYLDDRSEAELGASIFNKNGINTVLSDRIPLNRTLRDPRNSKCRDLSYSVNSKISVILIFHNEHLSVILRTVWSIVSRTPQYILGEIILVDDASTEENLSGFLDYYIKTRFNSYSVKLIHLKSRSGLIRARLEGAKAASSDIIIFLDAHCEVTIDWSEPLIARIEENPKTIAIPTIDSINGDTFAYTSNPEFYMLGGFSWSGYYSIIPVRDPRDLKSVAPVATPMMAGGLLAINRLYFWEVGSYDKEMLDWGGENLEMSFRVWQCGGRLEVIPCSRVGHIFRPSRPYSLGKKSFARNGARMAEVWMDDYKRLYYMSHRDIENSTLIGDLTPRKALRQKLNCKSFKWYLDNIYPEKFVPDENVYSYGQVRNKDNLCIDNLQIIKGEDSPLGLYNCHNTLQWSQYFSITLKHEFRQEYWCVEATSDDRAVFKKCNSNRSQLVWDYFANYTIFNRESRKCLSSKGVGSGQGLILEDCSGYNNVFQKWEFSHVNLIVVK